MERGRDNKNKTENVDNQHNCNNWHCTGNFILAYQGYKKTAILVLAFLGILMFRCAVMERIIINGSSMQPTFIDGDVCIARKFDVEPQKYDIVIAKIEGKTLVKRVLGLPGETLQVIAGEVYINGEAVDSNYDFFTEDMGLLANPYTVGENEFFIMGDNRAGSCDSRDFGSVKREDIKGIVVCRIFPFWKMAIYSR